MSTETSPYAAMPEAAPFDKGLLTKDPLTLTDGDIQQLEAYHAEKVAHFRQARLDYYTKQDDLVAKPRAKPGKKPKAIDMDKPGAAK